MLEVIVRDLEEPADAKLDGADVVDQDIQAPMLADRLRDQFLRSARFAEVDGYRGDAGELRERVDRARARDDQAPSSASARTTARPMPLLAPVTTATLSSSSRST